jgi:ketosteroid isomerase-like protein
MSQENVDFVRSLFGAWEQGDYSSTDWADTEIEYVIADGPAPARRTGLSGLAEAHASGHKYHDTPRSRQLHRSDAVRPPRFARCRSIVA